MLNSVEYKMLWVEYLKFKRDPKDMNQLEDLTK